jgi:hypothetical protein
VLPLIVLFETLSVQSEYVKIPPPLPEAEFPLIVLFVRESVPKLAMPPPAFPFGVLPFVTVSPEMLTVVAILNMRNCGVPPAELRWTVSKLEPGPVMVRVLLMLNSAVVKVIGLVTIAMLKVIVDASHASAIAWRRLPAPLSELLTTTGSVVQTGARVEILGAEAYVLVDAVVCPLSPSAVGIAALSEAFEVTLGRAATKTVATTSVTRKTVRATKRPRGVREKCGLMFHPFSRGRRLGRKQVPITGMGGYPGLFEGDSS